MPDFEFIEEGEIQTTVSPVFQALQDINQWSTWWPGHPTKIRGPETIIQEGSVIDVQVKGYAPITVNLVATITEIIETQAITEA